MAKNGDCWKEPVVASVTKLLNEYKDLFPPNFTKVKGIKEEVENMKVELKVGTNSHRKRPYHLNPNMKQSVKT